ncbi:hypothetical protein L195_g046337 [Trifolium pratense]|uniref:Uncharacterized protein n=1 Tax=Trifolium pratense TaxID=57577 RepID=A0A2K3MHH2_TRIPR|nr:hypothetical protein L195_g046337 [Trifolium pratense]
MKITGNIINKLDDIWCRVLLSKYGRNNDHTVVWTSQPYDSTLWKVLAGLWIFLAPLGLKYWGWMGSTNIHHFTVQSAYRLQHKNIQVVEGDYRLEDLMEVGRAPPYPNFHLVGCS